MAENFVFMVFFSFFDLIKGTLFNFLIPFIFVLIGVFFKRVIEKKFKFSWIVSSFISIYFLILFIVLFAYFIPLFFSFSETLAGLPPIGAGITLIDFVFALIFHFFRLLVVALIFSFVVVPFIFLGSIVFESIEKKFKLHYLINLALSVFVCLMIFFALWGFAFQGLERGVIYFIYFWFN